MMYESDDEAGWIQQIDEEIFQKICKAFHVSVHLENKLRRRLRVTYQGFTRPHIRMESTRYVRSNRPNDGDSRGIWE
jgi:hypothetical protein